MDRKIAQKSQRYFVTGVSMITTDGPQGQNVMAAEWTMQISYDPLLIAVFIHEGSSTLKNIKKTKQFGVNVAADEQTIPVSISGGYSRKEIDKLQIRGYFRLLKPKLIKAPLIAGCIINAECTVVFTKKIGDHTMVVGKAISIHHDETKKPLVYHQGRYFNIGSTIEPFRYKITVNSKLFNLLQKKVKNKFLLKCVGIIVKSGNKILVSYDSKNSISEIIPCIDHMRGQDYKNTLKKHLNQLELNLRIIGPPILKRLILKHKNKVQRINFIIFEGKLQDLPKNYVWKPIRKNAFLKALV